jgi:undecaprenyl diphosphate synthase
MTAQTKRHKALESRRLPAHIAIIMDGNGRWAKKRGLPRVAGHRVAMESVRAMVETCREAGVPYLTLYTFSSENWRSPRAEVSFLMRLLVTYLRREVRELHREGVRITAIGRLDELPKIARQELDRAMEKTRKNNGLILTLAVNYGGRNEILDAARKLAEDVKRGRVRAKEVDEKIFSNYLYHSTAPDPDLVIRTSGECRVSNFLLWQAAYSELYFTPVLWPDFRKPQLLAAIREYQKRERRFGDIAAR